ncbi:FAD-dependent monooxygenase [Streptomyces sp. NA04227]|uniref:FAD-dependent monooxygenase n=1 Tax=Streptomyces sp. NA04227 TaxID=2742136 RepID=UPI00158FE1FD|nr:FAD-dependent monooxygenase [Streptomyces sp. NA04227]QKW06489.1 FAD-dependent monooxygenase [Streptomyces sp. NA04227]
MSGIERQGDESVEVVVVGSGPTGLLLAGDLAAAGISVTVVEKRPRRIGNLSRAFVLHARTLEQLDARGLAEALEEKGRRLDRMKLFGRLTVRFDALPSRFNHVLMLPQYEVEKPLLARAEKAGVRFLHETELVGLDQDVDGVTLHLLDRDGASRTLRAAYAVGADGLRSTVRESIGLSFPGRSVIRSVVLADVRLREEPTDPLTLGAVGGAFVFLAPFGDGYYRVIGWRRGRAAATDEPVTLDEVRETTRLALGRDFGMHDARWLSRFHSDERQAPAYRVGRVFLAGDAAHVHTPAGGQGMNTGLQDAANLGWKLAAVLRGRARDELLDTYQEERHPVGRAVLRSSGAIVRLAVAARPWTRAARAALTAVLGISPFARAQAVARLSGIAYAYRAPRGSHRLTGRRAPDHALTEGRLYEALRAGQFVLVTPKGTAPGLTGLPEALTLAHWADARSDTVLVRPDGYVAWADDEADVSRIRDAVNRWMCPAAFGPAPVRGSRGGLG